MTTTCSTLKQWCDAVEQASAELSTVALGLDGIDVSDWDDKLPVGSQGSYIPVVSDNSAVHIGVVSNKEGCVELTRMLLGMEPDEELSQDDVTDAMGEVVNILAGAVKTVLAEAFSNLILGLPIVIDGRLVTTEQQVHYRATAKLGPAEIELLILLEREKSED